MNNTISALLMIPIVVLATIVSLGCIVIAAFLEVVWLLCEAVGSERGADFAHSLNSPFCAWVRMFLTTMDDSPLRPDDFRGP